MHETPQPTGAPATRRRWIAVGLVVLTVVTVAALTRLIPGDFLTQRRATSNIERADVHLAAGELDKAKAELRSALQFQPGNAEARRKLAATQLRLGQWELAFLELQSVAQLHPQDTEAWMAMATLMAKSDLLEAPERALDRVLEQSPTRADAHRLRGEIRYRLGRYHGALRDAEAAMARDAKDPAARTLLARATARENGANNPADNDLGPSPAPPKRFRPDSQIDDGNASALLRERWPGRLAQIRLALEMQLRQQNWTEAQRMVDAAREKYGDAAGFAPWLAAIVELARGNTDTAEKHLHEALAAAPGSPIVVVGLAKTWSRKNGAAYAGEELMRLAERDPSFAFVRYMAARAYLDARNPDQAEAALKRGLILQPDSAVPYRHLAEYYLGLDQAPEALAISQQGVDRFPTDTGLQMTLAQIHFRLGKTSEAVRVYEVVRSKRPDLDLIDYELVRVLVSKDKDKASWERAAQIARPLQNDRPSDPLLLDTLGWMYVRSGDIGRARELLESAVKGAPEEPAVRFHLATVDARENRLDSARRHLQSALDSNRMFDERVDALRLLREIGGADDSQRTPREGSPQGKSSALPGGRQKK
jgi:tetratricopeptide (TPR) repeat protein